MPDTTLLDIPPDEQAKRLCQVVGDDSVTRQQQALSGRDCHQPNA